MKLVASFRISIQQPGIFRRQILWLSIYDAPVMEQEFSLWMLETFGPGYERWWLSYLCKKVRSSRGAGNRGGWESKPYWVLFNFSHDADAIVFKMRMQDNIVSSESIPDKFYEVQSFREVYR